ncbi:MAG TPA: hypothetical protein VK540_15945 [Polyangiaceae bacterium]|nr:hypothetical protein [Polyangiaceae bacterium]
MKTKQVQAPVVFQPSSIAVNVPWMLVGSVQLLSGSLIQIPYGDNKPIGTAANSIV